MIIIIFNKYNESDDYGDDDNDDDNDDDDNDDDDYDHNEKDDIYTYTYFPFTVYN